jgi:hypothetical protein
MQVSVDISSAADLTKTEVVPCAKASGTAYATKKRNRSRNKKK